MTNTKVKNFKELSAIWKRDNLTRGDDYYNSIEIRIGNNVKEMPAEFRNTSYIVDIKQHNGKHTAVINHKFPIYDYNNLTSFITSYNRCKIDNNIILKFSANIKETIMIGKISSCNKVIEIWDLLNETKGGISYENLYKALKVNQTKKEDIFIANAI